MLYGGIICSMKLIKDTEFGNWFWNCATPKGKIPEPIEVGI